MNTRNAPHPRVSVVDGGIHRMTRRLVKHILLSTSQAIASCGSQGTSQEYGWYRKFEGRRRNAHDFKKPR